MAYIVPNTTVQLLNNIPFDVNHENTMYFETLQEQDNYFSQNVALELNNQSYQRTEKGSIRIGMVSNIEGWSAIKYTYNANYMRFKNTNFENKWFYAFIDSIEYINNNCVEIFYHLDVIQTWICDWTFNQCMIERAHTPDDTLGAYTYPEGLETGPYVDVQPITYEYDTEGAALPGTLFGTFIYTPGILLVSSISSEGLSPYQIFPGKEGTNCKTFSGVSFYRFGLGDYQALKTLLEELTTEAAINSVLEIMMVPLEFFPENIPANGTKEMTFGIQPVAGVDGYVPRNKKLYCYPYSVIYCTNNQGTTAEYWPELFTTIQGQFQFGIWANIGTNITMMAYPKNYKKLAKNIDEKITVTGFPICAWTYDTFKAWLAQNAGTIAGTALGLTAQWAAKIGGLAAGVQDISGYVGKHTGLLPSERKALMNASGGGASSSGNLLGATAIALGQLYDHSRQPPQAKGMTDGSFAYSSGQLTFNFMYKQIKKEYAEKIDEFFDMYGYKIMRVGFPQMNIRPCYTYIKTIGCSINANIPAAQSREIESIFDKGIRFWRTTAVFGNFRVNDNSPVATP